MEKEEHSVFEEENEENLPEHKEVIVGDEKRGKKWYYQRFKKEWLRIPEFRPWLRPCRNDPFDAYCRFCETKLKRSNKTMLRSHMKSKKHVKNSESKVKNFQRGVEIPGTGYILKAKDDYYEGQGHEIDTSANQADPSAPISVIISDPSYGNGYRRASRYDDSGDGMQQTPRNKEDDSCDAFGRYVASQLKKLPIKDMLEAQVEIQQLLIQKRLNVMDPEQEPDHNMPHL